MTKFSTLLTTCLLISTSVATAQAQDSLISLPGMQLQADGKGGAVITMPGMKMKADGKESATITQQNMHVQVDNNNATIRTQTTPARTAPTRTAVPTRMAIQTTQTQPTSHSSIVINGQPGAATAPAAPVQMHMQAATTTVQPQTMSIQTNTQGSFARQTASMPGKGMSYINADLTGHNFTNKYLVGADFTNANLTNVNFTGSDLRNARFINADLTNAQMISANVRGADFTNATFIRTNLTNSDLSQTNLTNVTVQGALAVGTKFAGANLTNVDVQAFIVTRPTPPAPPAPVAQPVQQPKPMAVPAPRPNAAPDTYVAPKEIKAALEMPVNKPKASKKLDLTINFEMDSDILTTEGMTQVQAIGEALSSDALKGSYIIVEGHTDSIGNEAYNEELSYRRAMRVLFTLRDKYKIPSATLEAKGYGEKRPLVSNATKKGQAKNRRVTLINMGK